MPAMLRLSRQLLQKAQGPGFEGCGRQMSIAVGKDPEGPLASITSTVRPESFYDSTVEQVRGPFEFGPAHKGCPDGIRHVCALMLQTYRPGCLWHVLLIVALQGVLQHVGLHY